MDRLRSSPRRLGALMAVVVAALALTGCFKATQQVKIRPDGTGQVVLHVEIDKQALTGVAARLDLSGGVGVPLLGPDEPPFKLVDRTFPDGTKVRTTDGPKQAVLDASFAFERPEQYRQRRDEIDQAVTLDSVGGLPDDGSLQVRRVDDRVEVVLDLGASAQGVGGLDFAALTGILPPDAQPSAVLTMTLPGPVVGANGRVAGRTVTWDLLATGAPTSLTATSTVAAAGLPSWIVPAVVLAILAVVLLVALLVLRRRRRSTEPATPPVTPPTVPPGAPSATPPMVPRGAPVAPPMVLRGTADAPPSAVEPSPPHEPVDVDASVDLAPSPADVVHDAEPAPVPAPTGPAPGWYPDPGGTALARYWDGNSWTRYTR